MGKIVTIYLSDQEARDLGRFCEENRCTQYSALKTAVKQLLFEPIQLKEETPGEPVEESKEEDNKRDKVVKNLDEILIQEPDPLASLLGKLFKDGKR